MTLQHIADRLIADLVPQIGQRPHNPVIAPVTIFPRHPNDQLLNLSLDPRPAGASTDLRTIEFAGHELAVPSQDGVRPGDIGHLAENLAAQSMTDLAERGSLGVRELQPPFNWAFKMRFSAARYSIRASSSWSTIPVTKARMRATRAPHYLIRDRDRIYGVAVMHRLRAMGIRDKPIAPGSPWQTDVIDKRFLGCRLLCCRGARATAWRRAGFEVRALPRSHYCRSSFAALVRTLGPLRFQPATNRS